METNQCENGHSYSAHYFDEIGYLDDKTVTAFNVGGAGIPELRKAAEIMKTASNERLTYESSNEASLMQYGFTMGDSDFLHNLAEFLSLEYVEPVHSNDLIATSGASHGISTLGCLALQRGDFVFLADVTFFAAIDILEKDLGMSLVKVPIDENGIDVDALDILLTTYRPRSRRQISEEKPFWAAVYVIPCFQNPTGRVLGEERSRKLIEVARKHDVLVISDDVYNLLSYMTPTDRALSDREFVCPKRLFAYDDKNDSNYKGNVVSVCSFSKIFAPGLRLGWYELPPRVHSIVRDSGLCQSSGGFNTYTSGIVATAINRGLITDNLNDLRRLYKKRMDRLIETLEQEIPPQVTFTKPKGGYHLWIELPKQYSSSELLEICQEKYKVAFALGPNFSPDGQFQNCLRLSIAYVNEEDIVKGAQRLCSAIKRFLVPTYEE